MPAPDLSKVALARVLTCAGGEASGLHAHELDGARMIILEFYLPRTDVALAPLGFTLAEAIKLRAWLDCAIQAESAKAVPA